MTVREAESSMLKRCTAIARDPSLGAQDQQEANVFRVAAMVVQSRLPRDAARLMQASEDYFSRHPGERVAAADVVRKGWVLSLPRLRDMLSQQLRQH